MYMVEHLSEENGSYSDSCPAYFSKGLRCEIVSENESPDSSLLTENLWKRRFIHAPSLWSRYMSAMHLVTLVLAGTMYNNDLLGGNYDLHIFSMTLQDSFLSTNWYLMMMENFIILCVQRILLKNKTILLAWGYKCSCY